MRPVIRLMIRNGEPSDVMEELVRQTYVEVADKEFGLPNRKQSASRISLLTGIHRREVARLRDQLAYNDVPEIAGFNRVEAVIAAWIREPDYLTKRGEPRVLRFTGKGSFSELVERFGRDVTPRVVVDELTRVGTVEYTEKGGVKLLVHGYVPAPSSDEQIAVYGHQAEDFLSTLDINVTALTPEDRMFQRQVTYNRIPEDQVPAFEELSARLGQRVLEQLDAWLKKRAARNGGKTVRLGLGVYQILGESHKEDPE